MRIFKLKVDIPFLKKGQKFAFEDQTGCVYGIGLDKNPDEIAQIPLRTPLAGYLYLLATEKKYMEFIEEI